MNARKHICLVCSAPITFEAFLAPWVRGLTTICNVTVVMNTKPAQPQAFPVRFVAMGIERQASPARDLMALLRLYRFFRREQFDAVHSVTPKAGLLAMMAAWLAGVACRHHTFTGQVWATKRGVARWFLKAMDRVIVACASTVLADSPSQLGFLVEQGVVPLGQGMVLGSGSICGVSTGRFKPDPERRAQVRGELGIGPDALVYLYIGRLKIDKGIIELVSAYASLVREFPDVVLLLVGPDEEGLTPRIRSMLPDVGKRLVMVGQTPRPERYMQASDVLCLPSYREGFGNVIIEAAACGLPCIGSRIYGITDAVQDGVTGYLHLPRDVAGLHPLLREMRLHASARRKMGEAARHRAAAHYSEAKVVGALMEFYRTVLGLYQEAPTSRV